MNEQRIRTIDGYRICSLSTETRSEVESELASGQYDGIAFNPYCGWVGKLKDFLGTGLKLKAVTLPFADKLGFTGELINQQQELERLVISEFTGKIHIESERLKVLGLMVKPGITLGALPMLRTIDLRSANEQTLKAVYKRAANLAALDLSFGSIKSLSGIEALSGLQSVELSYLRRLESLSPLSKCPKLDALTLYSVRTTQKLEAGLQSLASLRDLRMANCGELENLAFLNSLKLEVFRCLRTKLASPDRGPLSRIQDAHVE